MLTKVSDACPDVRQHLATRAHLRAAGLGSGAVDRAVRSGTLLRVRRGVYSPRPLPATPRHAVSGGVPDAAYVSRVRAVILSLGGTPIAAGRTAAALWGFDMLVEPNRVEVVAAEARPVMAKDVAFRRLRGAAGVRREVLGLEPLMVLSAADTVADCAINLPLREAVVIADSALRAGAVGLDELRALALARPHHPRWRRVRRVVSLVDPQSGSVLESVLRVLLAQHELHPESQVTLADVEGRLIGRVDFLFREQRLVVECDGRRWHDPDDARERDRVRDNELERAGWRLVRVTWSDVVHRPQHVIRLVQDCLSPWPLAA